MSETRLPPDDLIRVRVKAELRKRLRGLRMTMPADACAKRSALIVERVSSHASVAGAKSIALFWPIVEKHEVDLRPLDDALRARGVAVAYPGIDPETRLMTFRFARPDELEERGFGFREPASSAREATRGELDVILVPAIALDPTGHRIGYGAGFYDRTLPRFAPPAAAIGVAYDFQLVAEVPFTEHDVPLRFVVTDARAITTAHPTD
jgi:5-formyltetrahydrofolate cyclo-ligase